MNAPIKGSFISSPRPAKSPSHARVLTIVAAILLIPVLGMVVWYVAARESTTRQIRKLEQQVRDKGEPLTLGELAAKYPPIPDEGNAAVPLLALWSNEDPAFWRAFASGSRPLPKRISEEYDPHLPYLGSDLKRVTRERLDSNTLAVAKAYLGTKASHIQQMRAALLRPRFRFQINMEDGPDALLPHLPNLKNEALNLSIIALVASEDGDKASAIAAIRDTSRTGQILSDEPMLISQLVRLACLNNALGSLEQLFSRQRLTADDLEQIRAILHVSELHGVARAALVDERPFSLGAFDPDVATRIASSGGDNDGARKMRIGLGVLRGTGLFDSDRRFMLETFGELIALASEETPESLQKIDELFERLSSEVRKFPPKIISGLMLPALRKVPSRFASFEAKRRATLTAVAIERYRLEHQGTLPDKLNDLVPTYLPEIPADPFDGQALRFRKLERGYVIYSVGSDREDNGGKEREPGSDKNWDITFFVER
jgi:hypothetical protein